MPATAPRMSAEERREQVLAAALPVFAASGYAATSTEVVAAAAGISQPYLFRLFATKRALFIAVVQRGFARVEAAFAAAADGLTGTDALAAMGQAYGVLLADRDLLLTQLHAYAACADPEIRTATRAAFRSLWVLVAEISGLGDDELTQFLAHGMLLNVIAAMEAADLTEGWVRACLDGATA